MTLKAPLCSNDANDVWQNNLNQGRTYEERTCCEVGTEVHTSNIYQDFTDQEIRDLVCKEKFYVGLIIGLTIGGLAFGVIAVYVFIRYRRKRESNSKRGGATLCI